jgi:uncharacterized protein YndB with AHSA1/START domain
MTKTVDTTATQLPAIERELTFAASPERVWRAITDSNEISAWFPDRADLQAVVGYEGWFEWDEHGRSAVLVEEVEPMHRFAWRWENEDGKGVHAPGSTLVEWTLEPRSDGGTTLRMRESGFIKPNAREGNEEGWTSELSELTDYIGRD